MNQPVVELVNISFTRAKSACQKWHYSGTLPSNTTKKYGFYEDGKFIGIVSFGTGANNNMLNPFGLTQQQGCELTRIALREHKCFVSQVMMMAIKKLKRDCPDYQLIVSYSDEGQKHLGKVYQATNWIYTGTSEWQKELMINGKIQHARTIYEKYGTNSVVKLIEMGYDAKWIEAPSKHRYLYPLNKKIRKKLLEKALPYPKEIVSAAVLPKKEDVNKTMMENIFG